MSAVTLNLRTSTANVTTLKFKSSRQKPSEQLPSLTDEFSFLYEHKEVTSVFQAETLELQILAIRANLKSDLLKSALKKLLIYWFFNLNSGSCLRTVIASELNKDALFYDAGKDFHEYLSKQVVEAQIDEKKRQHVFGCVLRCCESCKPAKIALTFFRRDLIELLRDECVDLQSKEKTDLSVFIRALLLVQSLRKGEETGLTAEVQSIFEVKNLSTDSRSQIAIFIINEFRGTSADFLIPKAFEFIEKHLAANTNVSYCCSIHLVNALIISLENEQLFGNHRVANKLYDFIADISASESDFIVTQSSAVLQLANRLWSFTSHCPLTVLPWRFVLCENLENYAWSYLISFVPKTRANARSCLSFVIRIMKKASYSHLTNLVRRALRLSWKDKSKYVVLSILAKEGNSRLIMCEEDKIAMSIMANFSDSTTESLCVELYENLVEDDYDANNSDKWIKSWLGLLLDGSFHVPLSILERLSKCFMKMNKPLLISFLEDQLQSSDKEILLQAALVVMRLDKITEIVQSEEIQRLSRVVLPNAVKHHNDKIRLLAFNVIISSRSSKEVIHQSDLELIFLSIPNLMVLPGAADRMDMIAMTKKLFLRMSERTNPSKATKSDADVKLSYYGFLLKVGNYFFQSLFEGANPSRRSIALETLYSMFKCFGSIPDLETKTNFEILVNCFHDSFEKNKELSFKILDHFPESVTQKNNPEINDAMWSKVSQLCKSFKPPDSAIAGYFAKYFCTGPVSKCNGDHSEGRKCCIYALETMQDRLNFQVKIAEEDLIKAAEEGPMYGTLNCLRNIISQASHHGWCKNDPQVTKSLKDILLSGYRISNIVEIVLSSDSPEGHLPPDFFNHCPERHVSAQLLLLCAWRSSKEVSLLIGDLCTFETDQCSNVKLNLNYEEIKNMSKFFSKILETIKHRGAFEQAYLGFCHFCLFLWKRNTDQSLLNPTVLLEEIIKALEEGTENRFCSTRRSAGVPFLIQAIVSTEPEPAFPSLMLSTVERLLRLATSATVEIKVHSLNILRALFRDSRLGESIESFIGTGVRVAIEGFKSSSWAERNSSTLLFSSLITRIFGVKRSKDELSKKNSITSRAFFLRFPDLHQFLLDQVTEAAASISTSQGSISPTSSAIFPVILILAKLQPSPYSEDCEKHKISDFFTHLSICSGSPVMKVRKLSSKCLVSLQENPHSAVSWMLKIVDKIEKEENSSNQLHGFLLQILSILLIHGGIQTVKDYLKQILPKLQTLLEKFSIGANVPGPVKIEALKILMQLLKLFPVEVSFNDRFLHLLTIQFNPKVNQDYKSLVCHNLYLECATSLCCQVLLHQNCSELFSLHKLLSSPIKAITIEALKCVPSLSSDMDVSSAANYMRFMLENEKDLDILDAALESSILLFSGYDCVFCIDAESLFKSLKTIIRDNPCKPSIISKAICLSGLILPKWIDDFQRETVNSWIKIISVLTEDADPDINLAIGEAIKSCPSLLMSYDPDDYTNVSLWLVLLEFSVDDNDSVREMAYQTFLKSNNSGCSFPMCQLPEKIVGWILSTDNREQARKILLQFANEIHQEVQDQYNDSEAAFDKTEQSVWKEVKVFKKQIIDKLNSQNCQIYS